MCRGRDRGFRGGETTCTCIPPVFRCGIRLKPVMSCSHVVRERRKEVITSSSPSGTFVQLKFDLHGSEHTILFTSKVDNHRA